MPPPSVPASLCLHPSGLFFGNSPPAVSYLSSHDPVLHFGLGNSSSVDSVVIVWPAPGTREVLRLPAVDTRYTVAEGGSPTSIRGNAYAELGYSHISQSYVWSTLYISTPGRIGAGCSLPPFYLLRSVAAGWCVRYHQPPPVAHGGNASCWNLLRGTTYRAGHAAHQSSHARRLAAYATSATGPVRKYPGFKAPQQGQYQVAEQRDYYN